MDRLISEKKAIEAINDYWGEMETPTIDGYINAIKSIPSVEPKTGHWIDGGEYICFGGRQKAPCICSVCRKSALNEPWYYCPNCGARMVEPQEKRCEDCNHYGKFSLECGRCDDDCSMYEPQESEVRNENNTSTR